jgi:hypothetical protein
MVPSAAPSLAPTTVAPSMPTQPPSITPSAAPTVSPTATGEDCTSYCAINGLATMYPSNQLSYGPYVLRNYFSVSFSILAPIAAPPDQLRNVFAIKDAVTGAGLLSFWVTEYLTAKVNYNGVSVVSSGSFFDGTYASQYTTITITVAPSFITLTSDRTGTSSYSYVNVPTYGKAYYVSVSLPGYPSSGGTVEGMSITGTCTSWYECYVTCLTASGLFAQASETPLLPPRYLRSHRVQPPATCLLPPRVLHLL